MQAKLDQTSRYWSSSAPARFDYGRFDPRALRPFTGTHPAVVQPWLAAEAEREFAIDPTYRLSRRERKHRWLLRLERLTGADFSKRHFKLVR
jgi:hypothetical protein